jgi:ethanolaminephosphotransferase
MIGLSFNILSCIINFCYTGLNGNEETPAWVILASGVLYVLYYIFDILDGKHSRNTGTSSPLGLLMDHGCDAITTFLLIFSFGSIIKIGNK